MADMRLLAAQRNLDNAERLGQDDRVKRIKKRILQLKKQDVSAVVEESAPVEKSEAKSEFKSAEKTVEEG